MIQVSETNIEIKTLKYYSINRGATSSEYWGSMDKNILKKFKVKFNPNKTPSLTLNLTPIKRVDKHISI